MARSSFFSASSAAMTLFKRLLEQAGRIVGIVRDEDVAGQTVADLAGLERRRTIALAELSGAGRYAHAEREDERRASAQRAQRDREIVDRAAQRLLEAVEAVLRAQ